MGLEGGRRMLADTHIILETPNPGIELVPAPFDWTLNVHKFICLLLSSDISVSFVLIFALSSLQTSVFSPSCGYGFGRDDSDKMNVYKCAHICA